MIGYVNGGSRIFPSISSENIWRMYRGSGGGIGEVYELQIAKHQNWF
jgi:hypothetical protein